jgi:hypothetical protein
MPRYLVERTFRNELSLHADDEGLRSVGSWSKLIWKHCFDRGVHFRTCGEFVDRILSTQLIITKSVWTLKDLLTA